MEGKQIGKTYYRVPVINNVDLAAYSKSQRNRCSKMEKREENLLSKKKRKEEDVMINPFVSLEY